MLLPRGDDFNAFPVLEMMGRKPVSRDWQTKTLPGWSMAEQMESRLVMEALERTAEMATRWTSSSIRGKVRQNSVPE